MTDKKISTPGSSRDHGIDLLRALSMFMIVCMHVLAQGGVMVRYSSHPESYDICWLLEAFCLCAVNCYGLISGYVGVKSRWRPSRYIMLYLTVWFYSAGITALTALTGAAQLTTDMVVKSLLPVSWKTYWYFSCYTALFFLMPFLNKMVLALSDRERRRLMKTLFLVFSAATVFPKIFKVDFLVLLGGYSAIWLIILYVFGACLRLTPPRRQHSRLFYLAGYALLAGASWGFRIAADRITRSLYGEARYVRMFLTYTSPTIFLCGVCLLLAFRGIHLESRLFRRITGVLASTCFSVYLIHTQPVIWSSFLKGAFKSWAALQAPVILFPVLAAAAGIYLVCSLADLLRARLFRLLPVRKVLSRLDRYVDTMDAHC